MRLQSDMVNRLRPAYEGRRALVTGGAGFIGGHLCDALVSLGATVIVLDDLSNSTLEHLAGLVELEPERVRFTQGSVLDDDALIEAADGVSVIFHLAALGSVPRSIDYPQRAWSVNATGTIRVLEAARTVRAQRIVLASSSSVYGEDPRQPRVESMNPAPLSPYAASKLAGETALSVWARCYGLETVSLRYFNVFGPRQPADSAYAAVVPVFAKKLLLGEAPVIFGDGSASRDFTCVDDAVLGTLLAGSSSNVGKGEVINLGTGRSTTVRELASIIAKAAGVPHIAPVFESARKGDVLHALADTSLAKQLLGYEPAWRLEDAVEEAVRWYRAALART